MVAAAFVREAAPFFGFAVTRPEEDRLPVVAAGDAVLFVVFTFALGGAAFFPADGFTAAFFPVALAAVFFDDAGTPRAAVVFFFDLEPVAEEDLELAFFFPLTFLVVFLANDGLPLEQ